MNYLDYIYSLLFKPEYKRFLAEHSCKINEMYETPGTWTQDLNDGFVNLRKTELTEEDLMDLVKWFPSMSKDLNIDFNNRLKQMMDDVTGKEVIDIILKASEMNRGFVIELCEMILYDLQFSIDKIISGISIKEAKDPANFIEELPFEKKAKFQLDVLFNFSENYYRPHLKILTNTIETILNKKITKRGELGYILNQLKTVSKNSFPNVVNLAIDEVRIIRNSEAHKHTLYDFKNERITFFNKRDGVIKDTLGPLTLYEIQQISAHLVSNTMFINEAYRILHFKLFTI